jgi:hypothetical protein
MEQRGWTQTQLGRELGLSQDWVSAVIHGRRDPGFARTTNYLVSVGWEVVIRPKREDTDLVKRRQFVVGAASAFFVQSPKTTPFHDPSYVELLAKRAAQALYQTGGSSLAATVVDQARKVNSAAVNGGRELRSAASEFMRRGSYLLRHAGRSDIAARFANSAIRHAYQAADPDRNAEAHFALIAAIAFNGREGSKSMAGKNSGQAVMLARRGLGISGISDSSRADLNVCLASALANVPGNEGQARSALKEALRIDSGPMVDRANIFGHAGNALRDMGERREALKMLEEAVRQGAPYSPFNQAQYLCDQIMITFDMRAPDLAVSRMNDLSYVVPLVDSASVDRQVGDVLRAAEPWATVSEVREARTRLRSVRMVNEDL